MSDQRAIFRIANIKHSMNVAARQICAHIEFAWISRRRDYFCLSEKPQFIAEFWITPPADLPDRACRLFPVFDVPSRLYEAVARLPYPVRALPFRIILVVRRIRRYLRERDVRSSTAHR